MVKKILLMIAAILYFISPVFAGRLDISNLPGRIFVENVITPVEKGWLPETLKVSPDGRHAGYILLEDGSKQVVVDGIIGTPYEDILENIILFSPDSQQVAYFAKRADLLMLVINGQEKKTYRAVKKDSLVFSPDSRRWAYIAKQGEKWLVVGNDQEDRSYDDILVNSLKFSPDSKQLVYAAQVDGRWVLVVNGKPGKTYDGIRNVVFSPDSRRIALVVRDEDRFLVNVEGSQSEAFSMIRATSLKFSPDSQQVAFIVSTGGKQLAVINGQKSKPYDQIGADGIIFSPDSHRTAYAAQLGNQWMVVTDGIAGNRYDQIMDRNPIFSPDSKIVVFAAKTGPKWVVVENGKEKPKYDGIGIDSLTFSPNSQRFAYTVRKDGKWVVIVNGTEARMYDAIGKNSLKFGENSQQFAYSARRGENWFVVLDGTEGRTYQTIVTGYGAGINFDSATFEYLSFQDNKIIHVNEKIPSQISAQNILNQKIQGIKIVTPTNKTYRFTFNPPDGTSFNQTIRQTMSVQASQESLIIAEREYQCGCKINKSPEGYIINRKFVSLHEIENNREKDQSNLANYLQKLNINLSIDKNGKLKNVAIDGPRNAPSAEYSLEKIEAEIRQQWLNVEGMIGRSVKLGDSWKYQLLMPLPDGKSAPLDMDILFADEAEVNGRRCLNLKYQCRLISNDFERLITEELKKIDGINKDPNVRIEMNGNDLIDPDTLLNIASEFTINIRMSFDPSKTGGIAEGTFIIKYELLTDFK